MNVDVDGLYIHIERLPQENDMQLLDRKRWIVRRVLETNDPNRALQLSKCYHYILHKHCKYPAEIHKEVGLFLRELEGKKPLLERCPMNATQAIE